MAPTDKDTTPRGQANEDQNTPSVHAQDHILLKALQDLVVRVMDPKQTNDVNPLQLGPEAEKLITAFQEFISGVVARSQSGVQNTIIEVSLDEENTKHQGANSTTTKKTTEALIKEDIVILEKPLPTFEEKLLRALRERVFNKMPIRLLCFEPKGSSFRISLLEKDATYKRLVSVLQGKMYEEEFRPMTKWPSGGMETEEDTIERLLSKYAGYAILSHTWLRTTPGEVTYNDWNKGLFNSEDPGYRKLVNFCQAAWKDHRLALGWMDTVCINKESSSELDESIRSMYNWYKRAAVCIIYLAETERLENIHLDPWFTRGWTLQEMLAPQFLKFYNVHWKRFVNDSDSDTETKKITDQIEQATTLTEGELDNIYRAPISRRMQLAATREVTREEDTAYSLMGIFDVSMSIAYGEGASRAFFRLLQEIMASSRANLDILNWAGPLSHAYTSRILPSSPQSYLERCSDANLIPTFRPMEPLTLSHLGLRVPVILMPGISIRPREKVWHFNRIGNYNAIVDVSPMRNYKHISTAYILLDNRVSGGDGWKNDTMEYQTTFAVFNFTETRNMTSLPKICIALGLECSEPAGQVSNAGTFGVIRTKEPIVFQLKNWDPHYRVGPFDDFDLHWNIKTDELAKHGMQLISLYL